MYEVITQQNGPGDESVKRPSFISKQLKTKYATN